MYVHTHVRTHTHVHTHMYTHTCTHTLLTHTHYSHTHVHTHTCTCSPVRLHECEQHMRSQRRHYEEEIQHLRSSLEEKQRVMEKLVRDKKEVSSVTPGMESQCHECHDNHSRCHNQSVTTTTLVQSLILRPYTSYERTPNQPLSIVRDSHCGFLAVLTVHPSHVCTLTPLMRAVV